MPIKDITGQTFARLTVIKQSESIPYGKDGSKRRTMWECLCECGTTTIVRGDQLKSGHTKSCGCLFIDWSKSGLARKTHGHTPVGNHSSEYNIWTGIKSRCYKKSNPAYKNYGGRGITVCDRWLSSFQNFFDDMGLRPSEKHSIDRIDNDGPYSPNNCKWSTRLEQSNNRRSVHLITANGKTQTISAWAREIQVNPQTLERRFHAGWSHHDIINKPLKKQKRK